MSYEYKYMLFALQKHVDFFLSWIYVMNIHSLLPYIVAGDEFVSATIFCNVHPASHCAAEVHRDVILPRFTEELALILRFLSFCPNFASHSPTFRCL
jgi:hypothetical protein